MRDTLFSYLPFLGLPIGIVLGSVLGALVGYTFCAVQDNTIIRHLRAKNEELKTRLDALTDRDKRGRFVKHKE